MFQCFKDRELVVVTGKGGVGKSALSAALAQRASRDRRVLVLEVDPRENVHQFFGAAPSDGAYVELVPGLFLQNLKPGHVLDELVRERLRITRLAERVLDSAIYRRFVEGAPGLEEMAILGHALRVIQGKAAGAPDVDVVVLDAPATGHGVSLLAAPLLVAEVIEKGPIGEMTREVAEWIADASRTAIAVVTLAEEMPVTEALELRVALKNRLARQPDLLVVNGLYPPFDAAARGETSGATSPAFELWRRRRALNEKELERLSADWQGPSVELPLLPLDRSKALTEALVESLDAVGGLG